MILAYANEDHIHDDMYRQMLNKPKELFTHLK
jgi:hypothetical protein